LSKATQQNASASEELAATSEELSGQAEQLQQSVAFFTTRAEAAPVRKGRLDPKAAPERRSAASAGAALRNGQKAAKEPGRTAAAPAATGTHGNFRPY
jgi:methyl-accepting chemotaxis protein